MSGDKKSYAPEVLERFWPKVDKSETCWIWIAAKRSDGYGAFSVNGRVLAAHRFAYEAFVGPIPDGLELHHDCAVRACVNPAHLVPTTRTDHPDSGPNVERSRELCNHGHPLDGRRRKGKDSYIRYCMTCNRERYWRKRTYLPDPKPTAKKPKKR